LYDFVAGRGCKRFGRGCRGFAGPDQDRIDLEGEARISALLFNFGAALTPELREQEERLCAEIAKKH